MPKASDIEEIIDRYTPTPENLIFMLQDIQEAFGFISLENMHAACDHAGVPLTRGYSVSTFYKGFRLEPKGEHEIRVCLGTACHLKGGQRIVEDLQRRLHCMEGETTEDMRFTLTTVNCVGACALAPVVVVDEEYIPKMTSKKLEKSLKPFMDEGAA